MLQMACNMEGSSTTSMHLYLQSPISCQLRVPLNLDELIPKMDQFFCFQFFQGAGPGNIKCIGFSIDSRRNWCFAGPWDVFFVQNKSSWTRSIDLLDPLSSWLQLATLPSVPSRDRKSTYWPPGNAENALAALFLSFLPFHYREGGQQSMWILSIIS